MKPPVYAVSLGPGNPQLISLQAQKRLQEADLIYYPQPLRGPSLSKSILSESQIPTHIPLKPFNLCLQEKIQTQEQIYKKIAEEIKHQVQEGKKICMACEGDISIYASIAKIAERLSEKGVEVRREAGISSYAEAAAELNLSLLKKTENMLFLSSCPNLENFIQQVKDVNTVVFFKVKHVWSWLYPYLINTKTWKPYYAEHIGQTNSFTTSDLSHLKNKSIPYFALLILMRCSSS
ncbi:MAG: precorrin-2 C(20)-methyltransferase [Cytophagales bacterium]|nr:precorrin-2 C(20)-methyltransferase [Cytophagales bacterium]